MNDKHLGNRAKKQRSLLRRGALRSPDGDLVEPSDPRWLQLSAEAKRKLDETGGPEQRKLLYKRPPKPPPPKDLEIPVWLERIRRHLAWASVVNPDQLVYKGYSKKTGAKAGKRKNLSHYFVIEPPLPHPFQEPTTFLWHGSSLRNAGGILSEGLRASTQGMLGPGVYLGTLAKARNYARGDGWGLVLYCEVALGDVRDGGPGGRNPHGDTIHCASGYHASAWGQKIHHSEWCVRDPSRVVVREIHLMKVV